MVKAVKAQRRKTGWLRETSVVLVIAKSKVPITVPSTKCAVLGAIIGLPFITHRHTTPTQLTFTVSEREGAVFALRFNCRSLVLPRPCAQEDDVVRRSPVELSHGEPS